VTFYTPSQSIMASPASEQAPQSVRFSDVNQEIEPEDALQHVTGLTGAGETAPKEPLSSQAEQELRNLSSTLQQSRFQAKRMENFSFEPVSLPPSRVSSRVNVTSNLPFNTIRHHLPRQPRVPPQANPPNIAHHSVKSYSHHH